MKNSYTDIHPTSDIRFSLSHALDGKKIVMAICGSVGALKSSELSRLLIRHGARVITVMSEAACELISPTLMKWSTGDEVITKISGEVEHVKYCGNTTTKADLFLIYPATANTISKIASGIDDTTVTTFATTAIGEKIKTIIVPSMHLPMYEHPIVKKNISTLTEIGIEVITPVIEEGKAKIASANEICNLIIDRISEEKNSLKPNLKGKKILITCGATVEYIDPFRIITNCSSGKMGAAIAKIAINCGADVTIVSGRASVQYPAVAKVTYVDTTANMSEALKKIISKANEEKSPFDAIIAASAVCDWKPIEKSSEKISTNLPTLELKLEPTVKIVDTLKSFSPSSALVAFRAIDDNSEEALIENAIERMQKANADFICLNAISEKNPAFNSDENEMILLSKSSKIKKIAKTSKENCALEILSFIFECNL